MLRNIKIISHNKLDDDTKLYVKNLIKNNIHEEITLNKSVPEEEKEGEEENNKEEENNLKIILNFSL